MPKQQVFISYSRDDIAFVKRLTKDLTQQGISIWSDEQIAPGEDWQKSIEKNLFSSSVILFIISSASIKSSWTIREIEYAMRDGIKIIPILIEDVDAIQVPRPIRDIQWIDFTKNYEEKLFVLLSIFPEQLKSNKPAEKPKALNKGYAFISYCEEDQAFVEELKEFLKYKGYAYWDYSESDRDYHSQFFSELEQAISEAKATLSIISESWKKSSWTIKEYIFSEEVGTPVFLLKASKVGPILIISGINYIDFTISKELGFEKLEKELKKKGL